VRRYANPGRGLLGFVGLFRRIVRFLGRIVGLLGRIVRLLGRIFRFLGLLRGLLGVIGFLRIVGWHLWNQWPTQLAES
jgi:hypothetical protein